MSLDQVMRSAISGLNAQQTALRNTASNVANVNTPGYVRTEVSLAARSVNGQGAGVEVAAVRRVADEFLQQELVRASGYTAYYDAQAKIYDRLQALLGDPGSNAHLSGRIDAMFQSFTKLATDPADLARRVDGVQKVATLLDEVGRLSASVQDLRTEADRRIVADVDRLNTALVKIDRLNAEISRTSVAGTEATGLMEQRQQAIEQIADIVDLRTVEQADGRLHLYTTSGLPLIDNSLRQLVYESGGQVGATSRFDAITVNRVDLATGQPAGNGDPLFPALRSGSLKGLVEMRDVGLVDAADMLGSLASGLMDALNGAHNASSAVPPPASLTGRNTGALATDPHGFTGRATFAALDASGAVVAQTTIDFSAHVTLGDVVTAVNAGLGGDATLTLSGGAFAFAAVAGQSAGVVVAQDPASPSARAGRGFADTFGLNDLVRADAPAHFDTGLDGGAGHGFGATGTVRLELRGPGGQIARSHTLDFASLGGTVTSVLGDLNTAFTGVASFALDDDGALNVTPAPGREGFAIHVADDVTQRGTTGVSFSRFFGLGAGYPATAASGMELRADIRAAPERLALARFDAAAVPVLSDTDNAGALALEAARGQAMGFGAAGGLGTVQRTVSEYAAAVLGAIGGEAGRTEGLALDRQVLSDEIRSRRDAVSGVNLDEELANMVLFQNAYNAAARLISTANQMYETLLNL